MRRAIAVSLLISFWNCNAAVAAKRETAATTLSKEADDAISAAQREYREDPMTDELRRMAYDPANIRAARDVLDRALVDYRSARIRDVAAYYVFEHNRRTNKDGSTNRPILIYCGMVNAPNRLGGMVGWQPQAWSPSGIPGPASCPSEYFETGLFRIKVDRIGPVGDDDLTRAFDPQTPPPKLHFN